MKYESKSFLWPARPRKAILPGMLTMMEKQDWVAQYKKNGTCTEIFVSPNKEVSFSTRHDDNHKMWSPTEKSTGFFQELPGNGWYVFLAELLHNKCPGWKDTLYVFDILVNDGEYLVGTTLWRRLAILENLMPSIEEEYSHHIVTPNVWRAKTITDGFKDKFDAINVAIDEGLVIKDPLAKLSYCNRKDANSNWQLKCRKPHKNYGF